MALGIEGATFWLTFTKFHMASDMKPTYRIRNERKGISADRFEYITMNVLCELYKAYTVIYLLESGNLDEKTTGLE